MNVSRLWRSFVSFSSILAILSALLVINVPLTYAAAGEGAATINIGTGGTGADDATYGGAGATGAVVVGTLSYVQIAFTVGASNIAANENNLTIELPSNLFATGSFETGEEAALGDVDAAGEWYVAYTDTDAGTTDNTAIDLSASAASTGGTITVQANQQMDATDIITVTAAVSGRYASGATAIFIQSDDTGADDLSNILNEPTISVTVADAAATVVLGDNSVVGESGTTTLNITLPFALDADDTIDITFPASLDVSGVGAAVTGTLEATDSITCAASGQVVTCTTSAATQANGTIIMTGIVADYVDTTNVTSVRVEDEGNAGNVIASDSSVATTDITVGDLDNANVQPPSLVASARTSVAVSFTTSAPIPSGGKVLVTFPAGYDISGASGKTAFSLSGLDGTWTGTVAGQVLTLTQSSGTESAAGAKSLTIGEIVNPSTTGATGTYTITTQTADSVNVETDAAVAADTITATSTSSSSSTSSGAGGSGSGYSVDYVTPIPTTDSTGNDDDSDDDDDDSSEQNDNDDAGDDDSSSESTSAFADLDEDHWSYDSVEYMMNIGVVTGDTTEDGETTFRPSDPINRAESATLMHRVFEMVTGKILQSFSTPFTDVAPEDWYGNAVNVLHDFDLVSGYEDETYRPNGDMTRAEFLQLAVNVYLYLGDTSMEDMMEGETFENPYNDVMDEKWYTDTVLLANHWEFVQGSSCEEGNEDAGQCFFPNDSINRAEAVTMLERIFNVYL